MTGDKLSRATATLAVLVVAIIAAAISFGHIEHLAFVNGQPLMAARALPLSVDGAVVASSLALLDAARRGTGAPVLARVMLGLGVLATLGANAISGAGHGPIGVGVAVLPAAAFIGSVEVLLSMIRGRSRAVPEAASAGAPEQPLDAVPQSSASAVPVSRRGTLRPLSGNHSRRRGVSAPEVVFSAELEAGKLPGIRAIKRQCRVGQDRAVQIKDELAARLSAPGETIEATA